MGFGTREGDGFSDRWTIPGLIVAMVAGLSAFLAVYVSDRRGNLAWDDAAYLQQGLQLARLVEDHGASSLVEIFRVRPKPPMLAAWIEAIALGVGRHRIEAIIVLAAVGPFVLLMVAVASIAQHRIGPRAGPIALLVLAGSPLALSYGAKVMVETWMGVFVLLVYDGIARVLERPTRGRAFALGLATGAAAMTKATAALLLAAPLLYLAVSLLRAEVPRIVKARAAFWFLIAAVLVAGPWYALNGSAAARFAMRASRYNLIAEGKTDSTPIGQRLQILAETLVGWPVLAVLVVVLAVGLVRLSRGGAWVPSPPSEATKLSRITLLGLGSGACVLLVPPHFDARFLLPAWPALAVCASGWILGMLREAPAFGAVLVFAVLGLGFGASAASLEREPRTTTYWEAGALIDELVDRHGVRIVGNIGDGPDWNVCKTGLINELRPDPSSCSVMHDLSRSSAEDLERLASRCDALIVLDRAALPPSLLISAPGLNRAYEAIDRILADDRFERVELSCPRSLPPLSIFVAGDGRGSRGAAPGPDRRRRPPPRPGGPPASGG